MIIQLLGICMFVIITTAIIYVILNYVIIDFVEEYNNEEDYE